jgi:rhodanese-related sulfurtransferase
VDVRSSEDYNQYHIPGSIHVPVTSLSDPVVQSDLDVDRALILASNGNTISSQAWLLLRSEGYEDVFILDGGLNRWVSIYSNPQLPAGEYTDDEVFKYQFRKAAGSNLMGVQAVEQNTEVDTKKKKSPVRKFRKKTKKSSEDGC